MGYYKRPLANGGHVVQYRTRSGRFQKHPSLGGIVCTNVECRLFSFPETINTGSQAFPMLVTRYPTHCHGCKQELEKT